MLFAQKTREICLRQHKRTARERHEQKQASESEAKIERSEGFEISGMDEFHLSSCFRHLFS